MTSNCGFAVALYCHLSKKNSAFRLEKVQLADLAQSVISCWRLYLLAGLVTAAELHEGYQLAKTIGHAQAFLTTLQVRNAKAFAVLTAWLKGNHVRETVLIERLPSPIA